MAALQADHTEFHDLLDQLEASLGGLCRERRPDYAGALRILQRLTLGCEAFREHCRRENSLFRQLDRRTGRVLVVHDALERQRQRVSGQRVVLAQRLCAAVNGGEDPCCESLAETFRTYSTGFRAQLAFEEYIMYPLVGVFLQGAVADRVPRF